MVFRGGQAKRRGHHERWKCTRTEPAAAGREEAQGWPQLGGQTMAAPTPLWVSRTTNAPQPALQKGRGHGIGDQETQEACRAECLCGACSSRSHSLFLKPSPEGSLLSAVSKEYSSARERLPPPGGQCQLVAGSKAAAAAIRVCNGLC